MAFERKILGLTTSGQDVLVCGIGLSIVVHSLTVVNDTGAARVVTLSFFDQANGVTLPLGKLAVGANASARWPDKVNLAPGDKLIASADSGAAVTLYAGYLQQGGAAPVSSAFNPRGVWSSLASYDALDIVEKGGLAYIAIQPSTDEDPSTATAYWLKLLDATVIAAALAAKADITYVDGKFEEVIGAAPEALNVLAELAAAIQNDPGFGTTVMNALAGKVATSRQVATSGLASGGGDLSADRTINVPAASGAETAALASTSKAATPGGIGAALAFVDGGTGSGTYTPDHAAGPNHKRTLTGTTTLANLANAREGEGFYIRLKQDGTGSRAISFGTGYKFAGGTPTASTAANAVDAISGVVIDVATPLYDCVFLKGIG
jgi:hypothetical protein